MLDLKALLVKLLQNSKNSLKAVNVACSGTCEAGKRATLTWTMQNLIPSGGTYCGVLVHTTPNNRWVLARGYYKVQDGQLVVNYYNTYKENLSGNFGILIFYTV